MHPAAFNYVKHAVRDHRLNEEGISVVEIGAYDVNGSVRPMFSKAKQYTGVDVRSGNGVDVVADGADWQPDEPVDVVVSTETLEHCPHWRRILTNAAKMLKPGGVLIVTAAAPEREPHGCDGGPVGDEHYGNISAAQLSAHLGKVFPKGSQIQVEHNEADHDVYAFVQKSARSERGAA